MNKQEIEKALNWFKPEIKSQESGYAFAIANGQDTNKHFEDWLDYMRIAVECMEQQLTGGWIPATGFTVIDTETGQYPDMCNIARREEWSENLIYCDIEGFAITEDGYLIAFDECGNMAYCPEDRFKIISEPYKEDKDAERN